MNKKQKTMKIIAIVGLISIVGMLAGCNASARIKTVIENTYAVISEGTVVLGIIKDKLDGSQVWSDIERYVTSLNTALVAVSTTLERVAPIVGANLAPKTAPLTLDPTGTSKLEAATERLLQSIE